MLKSKFAHYIIAFCKHSEDLSRNVPKATITKSPIYDWV